MMTKKISPFLNRYRKGYPCGIIYMGLMGVLVLGLAGIAFAQEEKPIVTISSKEIQGEISAIGRNYISIIYERDPQKGIEYEVFLPFDGKILLGHKQKISELNIGDTVKVKFEESVEESKEGKRSSRMAKIINFVKPVEKKPPTPTPPEPGDGIADDPIFQKPKK